VQALSFAPGLPDGPQPPPQRKAAVTGRIPIDGAGLVQLPLAYLAAEIESGRLVPLLDSWVQPQIDAFCLYYSSRRQMRPPLKALVDFLRESCVNTRGARMSDGR
jgi:DNA-binding transcriptional LysR family regulator